MLQCIPSRLPFANVDLRLERPFVSLQCHMALYATSRGMP